MRICILSWSGWRVSAPRTWQPTTAMVTCSKELCHSSTRTTGDCNGGSSGIPASCTILSSSDGNSASCASGDFNSVRPPLFDPDVRSASTFSSSSICSVELPSGNPPPWSPARLTLVSIGPPSSGACDPRFPVFSSSSELQARKDGIKESLGILDACFASHSFSNSATSARVWFIIDCPASANWTGSAPLHPFEPGLRNTCDSIQHFRKMGGMSSTSPRSSPSQLYLPSCNRSDTRTFSVFSLPFQMRRLTPRSSRTVNLWHPSEHEIRLSHNGTTPRQCGQAACR